MSIHVRSEKLSQRVSGLSLIEGHLNKSLDAILLSYSGTYFRNSQISKQKFFEECLSLDLSETSHSFLAERCKLNFHKDMRSSVEYGLELVFGWISEDIILAVIKEMGISVELAGEDRTREFLQPSEIGTSSDFLLKIDGLARPLEIVFAWNDHWKNTDKWDLRDSKFRHLVNKGQESLCLGVELPGFQGFLIDMQNEKSSFIQRQNPAWGNKNCYTLSGMRTRLKKIDLVLQDLSQFCL